MATPITGFPDATTTGVPAGISLTTYTGPTTITADGTVIENKIINGSLRITGDNVVLKNCLITYDSPWGINAEGAKNITIQDCDFVGPGLKGDANAAILGSGTFLRNDISKSENGIVLQDGASVVKGNFIHDLQNGGASPHYDGISVQGGQNGVLIEDNTVIARQTSDIFIKNDFGPINNVRVNHNLLLGDHDAPSYAVYVYGNMPNGAVTNISVTNNVVGVGAYGGYFAVDQASPTISNNVQLASGDYYPIPSGGPTVPPSDPTPPSGPTPPPTNPNPPSPPTVHTFTGTAGNDLLPVIGQSNAGNDTFFGLSGNDTVVGGAGADKIDGGSGIDTASYAGSNAAVNVNLKTGTGSGGHAAGDTLVNIENLTGSSYNDILTGNSANNVLDGAGGADTMRGLAGNDVYVVDNAGDIVDERARGSGGTDTVQSSISLSLADTAHVLGAVENLTLVGSANIDATGNALNNVLTGNSGNNTLNGGAGADTMRGMAGNDAYVVDNARDIVDEGASGSSGTDTVRSSISFSLADTAHVLGAVENLSLLGRANINATGNALNNVLTGNSGNNVLNGGAGDDTLSGGTGHDTFLFNSALNAATNVDRITDFSAISDTIKLENSVFTALKSTGILDGSAFHVGAAAHDAGDRIIYNPVTGALIYDSNGDAAGGATQFATLDHGLSLTRADFVVV